MAKMEEMSNAYKTENLKGRDQRIKDNIKMDLKGT
jgi:hypothetical protein